MKLALRKLLGSHGVSVMEVMIGGAVMAGVGLGGATLFKNQRVAQNKIEGEVSLTKFHSSLQKMLGDGNTCAATFKDSTAGGAMQDIASIHTCSNCTNAEAEYDAVIATKAMPAWIAEGSYIDNTNSWMIVGVTPAFPQGGIHWAQSYSGSGRAIVKVAYMSNPNRTGGGKIIIKEATVNLRFTSGTFKDCMDSKQSSINNMNNDVCMAMMGGAPGSGKIATWNDNLQKCELSSKFCTGVNQMVGGVDSNGNITCRDVVPNTYNAVNNVNATPSTCPAGPGARARVQVNADGTVQVICD